MESSDIANYLREKRLILVREKIEIKVYRWSLECKYYYFGDVSKGVD